MHQMRHICLLYSCCCPAHIALLLQSSSSSVTVRTEQPPIHQAYEACANYISRCDTSNTTDAVLISTAEPMHQTACGQACCRCTPHKELRKLVCSSGSALHSCWHCRSYTLTALITLHRCTDHCRQVQPELHAPCPARDYIQVCTVRKHHQKASEGLLGAASSNSGSRIQPTGDSAPQQLRSDPVVSFGPRPPHFLKHQSWQSNKMSTYKAMSLRSVT